MNSELTKEQKKIIRQKIRAYHWLEFKESIEDVWYIIWNRTLKLWWNKLWIRKDEFHPSLDLDFRAMLVMNKKQLDKYYADITRRRKIAHDREFKEDYAEGERLLKEDYGIDLQELRELNKTAEKYLGKK